MNKLSKVVAVSFLLVLVLSALLVIPTQAKPTSLTPIDLNSLKASKSADNIYIIEIGQNKITVEIMSNDHYILSYVNDDGTTTELEIVTVTSEVFNSSVNVGSTKTRGLFEKTVFVNGEESCKLPVNQITELAQSSELSAQPDQLLLSGNYNYWWDNVYFVDGQYIEYPHPDRDYYGISPYANYGRFGNQLLHFQWDQDTSEILFAGGWTVLGAAIGAIIGTLYCPGLGTGVLAVLGAVIGAIIGIVAAPLLLDEWDCLWFWINHSFLTWLNDNAWLLIVFLAMYGPAVVTSIIMSQFLFDGYLRYSETTIHDSKGIGNPSPPPPPPPHYYVSSIVSYDTWEYGSVSNPNGLTGSSNDGSYARIYGGNPGDGGVIAGWMNEVATGDIELYGYSASGYYTHLYVYVSYYNNYDWTLTKVQTVYPGSAHWIDCGSYSGDFRYIAIAAIDDNGMSANIYIDSVKVEA